ncbi:hypothetical protein KGQ20_10710 [Catenulispora sp. NF23]|uniref:DUF4034 domain-containing protein n=1 Tax=Catenulispora pinistramenti TaxID=2705254 RepID=A0ABS5KJN4_9ACTN|nr:hypothetical protein [Catenulispora pinistramenti]MBS2533244.1 hypothetical protein [Catenulispora pinistramenti]MBS2546554.1 hypothetical protein [Catenulispora pinistramenti]
MAIAAVAAVSVIRGLSKGYGGKRGRKAAARARARRPSETEAIKPVPIDRSHGDPELAALRQAARITDWPTVEEILRPVRDRDDFERLTFLIGNIEDLGGDFLLKLPNQLPSDPLALTVAGARHSAWAWEARTGYRASQVSEEQFKVFHDRLRVAEEYLYTAVELDPANAAPWYTLCVTSRGLEHGADVTRRRFEAGIKRAPGHVGLHRQMLQQLCAKWGGSHEAMHAFATKVFDAAPPGSGLGELVAQAHLEHWLDLEQGPDDVYIRDAAVVQDLRRAADASVFHPAFAPTSSPYTALNTFAMAFWLADDKDSAGRLFERIADHATKAPWRYRGDPERVFAVARQDCVKKRKK